MATRVLFWQETFLPHIGGVEVLAPKLLSGLRERGYEFNVVTRQDLPNLPAQDQYGGIPICRYPVWQAFADGNIEQLMRIRADIAKLKRHFAPDLIHINSFGLSALLHQDTINSHRAPILVTLHTTDRTMLEQSSGNDGLFGRTLRCADWVSCVSAAVHNHWRSVVPEINAHSSVIYNGVSPTTIRPEPLPMGAPRLLCLGRLCQDKGFDIALRGFATLSHRFPAARLIIAGEGETRAALENQVAELGLKNSVDFVGWVAPDKVAELINTTTMVLIPSRCEGLPTVAMEAGMMARPVIGTRIGGTSEIIIDQESGLLVEPENWEGLARAVAHLLDHPEIATKLGYAARHRVQTLFSFERYVDAYDVLYRKLIRHSAGESVRSVDHSGTKRHIPGEN